MVSVMTSTCQARVAARCCYVGIHGSVRFVVARPYWRATFLPLTETVVYVKLSVETVVAVFMLPQTQWSVNIKT